MFEIDWLLYSKMPLPEFGIVTLMFERVRWMRGDQEGGAQPCEPTEPGARAVQIENGIGFQSMIVQLSPAEADQFERGQVYRWSTP